MKYRANYRFATTIVAGGQSTPVSYAAGDEVEVEDWLIAELAAQVPGGLTLIIETPVEETAEETAEVPTVEMVEGATPKAKTRAVKKAGK
jgi:anti-sigma factor RsiW